jgi:hypothetical protein
MMNEPQIDEPAPAYLYLVTGIVVEQGLTRGRQFLLQTENLEEAREYKREHESLCGKQASLATVLFYKGPQIHEIKIIQCPIVE